MAIAYIFHFPIARVDSGPVSGDMRDSGLGISLFRFMQVPSKVPNGLMHVDEAVCFRDWGLFWAISRLSSWFKAGFRGDVCLGECMISRLPPGVLEKSS